MHIDREGSSSAAAAAGPRWRPATVSGIARSRHAVHGAAAVTHDRRLGLPDHDDQYAADGFVTWAAGVLHQCRTDRCNRRSDIRWSCALGAPIGSAIGAR